MNTSATNERDEWSIIIIGAGQAGLAAAYFLQKAKEDFIIIDAAGRIGDSWRKRWDSLRLFTPAQYDSLPGFLFPAPKGTYPTKNQAADYLEKYALKYNIPVRLGERVIHLSGTQTGFELKTSKTTLKCNKVIVATGTNQVPRIPEFAKYLDNKIIQIHSSGYVNPDKLPSGDVLVVGAGTSGAEIAIELSRSRKTYISGHPTFHIPDPVFRYAGRLYWWFASNILTIATPIGRKARPGILNGGAPLINVSVRDIVRAGVEMVPRVNCVKNGLPNLDNGRVIPVSSIVWATGYKPDYSWIDIQINESENEWPVAPGGISEKVNGLYFMGMVFQYGLTSGLLGGVGRDADYVVKHIIKH